MITPDTSGGILTIDLDALAANWRLLRARVAPAEVAAVVKANAYGLGVAPVARALEAAGCGTFFVSSLDEARELKTAIGGGAIFILNPPPGADLGGFVPVLNSLDEVRAWPKAKPAALKFDTGMARRGLNPAEADALGEVAPVLVISHLACAEIPDHPLNGRQRAAFAALRARWPRARAALANSSGAFLPPAYHFDMVRAGAALYGINPTPGKPNPMRPVVTLAGRIVQVREVDADSTVGYGAAHRFAQAARIATVAVGYADGYPRSLSNRGFGFVGGVRVPLVGRVSMDLASFDVTDAPQARPGGFIELIGAGAPVDAVADAAGTIGYEILTGLGRRYHRRYVGASG